MALPSVGMAVCSQDTSVMPVVTAASVWPIFCLLPSW